MLLAIDVGNSQISFGVFADRELLHEWRSQTSVQRTSDEYASFLLPLLAREGISEKSLTGVALCSVVPPVDPSLRAFCKDYLSMEPFVVDSKLDLPFCVRVSVREEIGADRLANSAFAVESMRLPAIVVDFGTATTFDVVSAEPAYLGGMIVPGIRLCLEALSAKTAKLPLVGSEFPQKLIGSNTAECIQSGVLWGYVSLIEGLVARIERELGAECSLALTGGFSSAFAEKLAGRPAVWRGSLTLEGVASLYRRNVSFPA